MKNKWTVCVLAIVACVAVVVCAWIFFPTFSSKPPPPGKNALPFIEATYAGQLDLSAQLAAHREIMEYKYVRYKKSPRDRDFKPNISSFLALQMCAKVHLSNYRYPETDFRRT